MTQGRSGGELGSSFLARLVIVPGSDRPTPVTSPLPFSSTYFCRFEAADCTCRAAATAATSACEFGGGGTRDTSSRFFQRAFLIRRDYVSPPSTLPLALCERICVNLRRDGRSCGSFSRPRASGSKRSRSARRWRLSTASSMKKSHTLQISAAHGLCVFFFYQHEEAVELSLSERGLLCSKACQRFLSSLFSSLNSSFLLPFFALSGLQGLRTQAPKDYQTHPFQDH